MNDLDQGIDQGRPNRRRDADVVILLSIVLGSVFGVLSVVWLVAKAIAP